MNMRIACPHCQVVGVVPDELRKTSNWPVACHHCHQHYYVPVISSPAPLSRQVELSCATCGEASALDKGAYEAILAEKFPLFCQTCHSSLAGEEADIVELDRQELDQHDKARSDVQSVGMKSALVLVFTGFFIVSVSVMAAHEGLISRDWLDAILQHLPERGQVLSTLTETFKSSSKTGQ